MGVEIPVDMIEQLKISLRREAKLSSYDPGGDSSGESLPNLPSAAEAIAELDASASYLRCRNCRGKLLRGIESLICVFCGKQQRTNDNPPDPIEFTSTSGYKWFLASLNLDGSEIVEPPKEMNESRRGRNTPVEGVAVSKFLHLEIQWGVKEEKSAQNGIGDGKSVQSKIPLNLGGFDLDDFFVDGRDLSKVEVVESTPVEDDFKDPRSLSSADIVKSQGFSEVYQHGNVGLFEGKDAQRSLSSVEHENLSFFAGQDAKESVSPVVHENLSLFEGNDVQESVSFKEHENLSLFERKDTQRSSSSKEDENLASFEGAPSSSAAVKSVDEKFVDSSPKQDTDFQCADQNLSKEQNPIDPFANSSIDLSAHMDTVFGSGKDFFDAEAKAKAKASSSAPVSNAGDWFQDDLFGNVNREVQKNDSAVHNWNEEQLVEENGKSSMDIAWIGDDLWQTSDKKSSDKVATDEDEDWNDFASSANLKTPNDSVLQTVVSFQEVTLDGTANVNNGGRTESQKSFLPTVSWTEDEKQNNGTSTVPDKTKVQGDDFFGAWNSFTAPMASQVPVQESANQVKPSANLNSEISLFGEANNHEGFDFGGFSNSDFFSGGFSGQNNSAEVKFGQSETSSSERTADTKGKDQTLENFTTGDLAGANSTLKANFAEELMSQMHDLSFMLESKLSIPPNSKTE